jgi:hypothetical protein
MDLVHAAKHRYPKHSYVLVNAVIVHVDSRRFDFSGTTYQNLARECQALAAPQLGESIVLAREQRPLCTRTSW